MASLHLAQEILNIIYPVGSVYLSWNSTDPKNLFGGTWTRLSGGFLYGCVSSVGTGNGTGTATNNHTLTIDQMPAHNHSGSTNKGKTDFMRIVGAVGTSETSNHMTGYSAGGYKDVGLGELNFPGSNHWHDFDTNNTGGGKGHSHNIPYIAVFAWRRTA